MYIYRDIYIYILISLFIHLCICVCVYLHVYIDVYIAYISAASARTLILNVLAQKQHFNQAWLKNLKVQEQSWMVQ